MAKFRVLVTLSLATLAVVAGQRQQFHFDDGPPPQGPRPSGPGPGRGPPPPSFSNKLMSVMQTQGRGIKELFTSASSSPYMKELFGAPRGPTHFSAPPKSATFFLEPPTRDGFSYYAGGRAPPTFGRSPAPVFKQTSLKSPGISHSASEIKNQLPQEYVVSSYSGIRGNRGKQAPSIQEIVAQAAQTQHAKVIQKEQRAHPNGRFTHSQIRVAGAGGPPSQLVQGPGFNPYASQVIGGQQDYPQLIMATGPDGNPMLLQVQSSGAVQYSGQQVGPSQFGSQQPGLVQYVTQQQPSGGQIISQQPSFSQFSGQQQIQFTGPQGQSFSFGGQQPIEYTSVGGQQPGQVVQYIQSSGGQSQGQVLNSISSRPSSPSSSPGEISLANYPQQYTQQSTGGGQQFDASPFLSQAGFPGSIYSLDAPSGIFQQSQGGHQGQQGQQVFYQSQGQGFGDDQSAYILQSQNSQQLQQNQIEQPQQAQQSSQSQTQLKSSQSQPQQFQIQPAISETIQEQPQRSESSVKPSTPGLSGTTYVQ